MTTTGDPSELPTDAADVDAVMQLELELHEPATRGDTQRLKQLLSPTFLEVGASGTLWDLDSIVEMLIEETAEGETPQVEPTGMTGRALAPDLIQLLWLSHGERSRSRRTSLWQRADTEPGWQLVYHQGTPVRGA